MSASRYGADAEVCQATYGGASKAELFVGPTNGDVADARSLTGSRYGNEPNAFLYRAQFNPVCAAQLQDGVRTVGSDLPALGVNLDASSLPFPGANPDARSLAAIIPKPQLRPRPSEDPETLANASGGIRPQPLPSPVFAIGATRRNARRRRGLLQSHPAAAGSGVGAIEMSNSAQSPVRFSA